MRGATSWIFQRSGHNKIGSPLRLGELPGWDRLRTTEVDIVRVGLAPTTELPELEANSSVALAPLGLGSTVVHTAADRPGHGDLAGQPFTPVFPQQRTGKDVSVLFGFSHDFPAEKNPHRASTWKNLQQLLLGNGSSDLH